MILENAQIESTALEIEDHGIFTFMIHVDYGNSAQGIGGYALDGHDENLPYRPGHIKSIPFIRGFMEVVGVYKWEDLKGKYLRVIKEDDSFNAKVIGIQNITSDKKLIFKEFWEWK